MQRMLAMALAGGIANAAAESITSRHHKRRGGKSGGASYDIRQASVSWLTHLGNIWHRSPRRDMYRGKLRRQHGQLAIARNINKAWRMWWRQGAARRSFGGGAVKAAAAQA